MVSKVFKSVSKMQEQSLCKWR